MFTFKKEPLRFLSSDRSNVQTYEAPQKLLQNQGWSVRVIDSKVWITTCFVVFSFFFFIVVATKGWVLLHQKALFISMWADEEQRNRSGFIAHLFVLVLIRPVL